MVEINNAKAFQNGIAKAKSQMRRKLIEIGSRTVDELLHTAIDSYLAENASLTGNLVTSITGGVYYDKKLVDIEYATDAGADVPSFTYAHIGDGGFYDYDTGELVESVKPYSRSDLHFTDTPKGEMGVKDAVAFLRSYKPPYGGVAIVVCAGARYAEYLRRKRELDVLTTASNDSDGIFMMNLKSFKL